MPGCASCLDFDSGNLPEFKKGSFVGNSWNPCPYSTQSSDIRTTALLGSSVIKSDHTDQNGVVYYLSPSHKGEWGYVCTFSGCPYIQSTGNQYFYR